MFLRHAGSLWNRFIGKWVLECDSEDDALRKRSAVPVCLLGVALIAPTLLAVSPTAECSLFAGLAGLVVSFTATLFALLIPGISTEVVCTALLQAVLACTITADLYTASARVTNRLFILLVAAQHLTATLRLNTWVTREVQAITYIWLWLTAFEDITRYGLYDFPLLPDPSHFVGAMCACGAPPCASAPSSGPILAVAVVTTAGCFCLCSVAASAGEPEGRGATERVGLGSITGSAAAAAARHSRTKCNVVPASTALQHMEKAAATCNDVALAIARFDLGGASEELIKHHADLPFELYAAFDLIIQNMGCFRPYLPTALLDQLAARKAAGCSTRKPTPGSASGVAALVLIEVANLRELWEDLPSTMPVAFCILYNVIRNVLAERPTGGYEATPPGGDVFLAAFEKPLDAISFSCRLHEELLKAEWPADLTQHPRCKRDADSLWGGLAVRTAVDVGSVTLKTVPLTGRTQYSGPPVEFAARMLSDCSEGSIVVSHSVFTAVRAEQLSHCVGFGHTVLANSCTSDYCEVRAFKAEGVTVHEILPRSLTLRKEKRKKSGPQKPERRCSDVLSVPVSPLQQLPQGGFGSASAHSLTSQHSRRNSAMTMPLEALPKATVARVELQVFDTITESGMSAILSQSFQSVEQTRGEIFGLIGTSLAVAFGAYASEDHPSSAFRFVYSLHYSLERVKAASVKPWFGLCSGLVIKGSVGTSSQKYFTAMGECAMISGVLSLQALSRGMLCYYAMSPDGCMKNSQLDELLVSATRTESDSPLLEHWEVLELNDQLSTLKCLSDALELSATDLPAAVYIDMSQSE